MKVMPIYLCSYIVDSKLVKLSSEKPEWAMVLTEIDFPFPSTSNNLLN